MTLALEPPLSGAGRNDAVALTHGPALVRSRGMSRWHRPRSGIHFPDQPPHPDAAQMGWPTTTQPAFTHYQFWCGGSASSGRRPRVGSAPGVLTRDALPVDGVPVCGTCEGRAIGAGHPPLAVAVTAPAGLLFEPRRLVLRVCPGYLFEKYDDRPAGASWPRWRATCLLCGETDLKLRGGDRGYNWTPVRAAEHPPGPGLVPGCPFHAWRDMHVTDEGRVECRCRS